MFRSIGKRSRGKSFISNNHELIKKIYALLDVDRVLVDACQKGHLELVKTILASEHFALEELNEAFASATAYGHIDIAKYMLNEYCINCDLHDAFKQNCQHENMTVCLWIFHDIPFYRVPESLLMEMFDYVCSNRGDRFTMALWLYSLIGESVKFSDNNAFRFRNACTNGNIRIAKWIWDLGDIDICAGKGEAFRNSCTQNNTEISWWLYTINPNIICYITNNDLAKINNKELFCWLITIGAKINYDVVFKIMCCNGKLEMAQWLTQIPEIHVNMKKYYGDIERHCRKKGHPEVLDWINK